MKNIIYLVLILLSFCCFSSFNVNENTSHNTLLQERAVKYSKEQINIFIREVYQDHADELFFNSNSKRLQLVTDFLNRIEFVPNSKYIKKEIPLLSSLELINKYNPSLKRDVVFDPKTFNPLKYNFTMTSKSKIIVRVDASEFVIAIQPAQ
jgi:hypothetical protein